MRKAEAKGRIDACGPERKLACGRKERRGDGRFTSIFSFSNSWRILGTRWNAVESSSSGYSTRDDRSRDHPPSRFHGSVESRPIPIATEEEEKETKRRRVGGIPSLKGLRSDISKVERVPVTRPRQRVIPQSRPSFSPFLPDIRSNRFD